MQLRDYQRPLYEDTRNAFRAGHKRVLCVLPCGGGKSCLFAAMVQGVSVRWLIEHRRLAHYEYYAPVETMTRGRVYVTVNNQEDTLKSITFYDRENKRFRQIDLGHYHKIAGKPVKPHEQTGYYHDGEASEPSEKDTRLIDKVLKAWHNR